MKKMIIYQVLPRLFGNCTSHSTFDGDIRQNGCGKFNDFTSAAFEELKKLEITHIWYTGVLAHATKTDYSSYGIHKDHPAIVKGAAGSPYAVKDYYDVDPDLAVDVPNRMLEFEALIERTHTAGLQFIMDFVPNHVSREYTGASAPDGILPLGAQDDNTKSFDPQNNFYYIPGTPLHAQFDMRGDAPCAYVENPAKATGNDRFDAMPNKNDWYEAVKLNYGVDYCNGRACYFDPIPDTWHKMYHILCFWASKGIDAFRCDMAEMVPVEFWNWVIPQIKAQYPVDFIAEVYNPNQYRNYIFTGKFDYLYDKVGLYDTLRNVTCGYGSANDITRCWQATEDIHDKMLHFMENHDEQRIASSHFASHGRKGRAAMVVSTLMSTSPVMIYFGQEFGELGMDSEGFSGRDGRTTIFDYWCVESVRRWRNNGTFDGQLLADEQKRLYLFYQRLMQICVQEKAIQQGQFFDLQYANQNGWRYNEHKQYSFVRYHDGELIIVVTNFDEHPANVGVLLPQHLFDYFHISSKERAHALDLFTNKIHELHLMPERTVDVHIDPYEAAVLKILL